MNNPLENPVVVIPLHHGGGKLRTDHELRYTLRALSINFQAAFRVVIIGRKLPQWIQGVEFIKCPDKGLKHALVVAAREFPEGFFWNYDDCLMLRPTTPEEMMKTPSPKKWAGKSGTRWGQMLEEVRGRLIAEGLPAHDYSRPHGPYFFNKEMIDEAFADWPGMKGKFPFETWILNKRKWPRAHGAVKQYYGAFKTPPGDGHRYLNYNDAGNTLPLRDWLREKFPDVSRFETGRELSKKEMYALQSRHLTKAWVDAGSTPLRTICECAVGPHSLLIGLEGKAKRTILIEPDPVMAAGARKQYPWAEVHQVAVMPESGTVNLRQLQGSSYIKGIPWAPAFQAFPKRARRAGKVAVRALPFDLIDDGEIDLINLDCEGSEWHVMQKMTSRPLILQIEIYRRHGHFREIKGWLKENNYRQVKKWGNANVIYQRAPAP